MNEKTKYYLKTFLVALVTVNLLFFLFLQFIIWKNKAELLVTPCELCAKNNPDAKYCFEQPVLRDSSGNIVAIGEQAKIMYQQQTSQYSVNFSRLNISLS
jgi:hypothetical protein